MLISAQELLNHARGRGIGDAAICAAVGVHPATLWRWRKGHTNPRFEQLRKLIQLVTEAAP